jgi:hypothetical protein
MTYTSKFIGNNMYQIDTLFNNNSITFNVIVAKDATELDKLVQFHLNYLENPNSTYLTPTVTVDSLQEQLTILQNQVTALIPTAL